MWLAQLEEFRGSGGRIAAEATSRSLFRLLSLRSSGGSFYSPPGHDATRYRLASSEVNDRACAILAVISGRGLFLRRGWVDTFPSISQFLLQRAYPGHVCG